MDPLIGSALIGGGASIIGGLFGSSSAKRANKQAARQAEISRQFTKEQMQNRHQWEVADLRKAGLNPVLSAMSGAPSMGGSAQAPVIGEHEGLLAGATASAKGLSNALIREQMKTQKATQLNLRADTRKKNSEARTTDDLGQKYRYESAVMSPLATMGAFENELFNQYPMLKGVNLGSKYVSQIAPDILRGMGKMNSGKAQLRRDNLAREKFEFQKNTYQPKKQLRNKYIEKGKNYQRERYDYGD